MFYTYLWLREDGTPYYVGKGTRYRAFLRKGHRVHRPPTDDDIVVQHYESEDEAFEAEKFLIDFYGRKDLGKGPLVNLADGGIGGQFGKIPWNKGKKMSPEFCAAISSGQVGHRGWNRGRRYGPETKAKLAAAGKGKKHRPESIEKSKIARLSYWAVNKEEKLQKRKRTAGGQWAAA